MKYFIGCDLGGTNLRAAVVDMETGLVLNQAAIPTQARDGHAVVMKRISSVILQVIQNSGLRKDELGGIGIGAPGMLDLEKGETLFLPNMPGNWVHVPLRDTIAVLTGLPTAILNDVRAITLGEWRFGAGQGVDTMAVFAIGTGIGGGLVINGKLHLGIDGTGGELGHMIIDFNGPRCGCGAYGCLETYASGPAIAAMGMKAVSQGFTTQIAGLCKSDLNLITPALIAQAAIAGDETALEIYEKAGYYLGVAAASICVSVGPRRIVMAGGVSNAGKLLLDPMDRSMRALTKLMPVEKVEIVPANLADNAGVIGTALWAQMAPDIFQDHKV